MLQWGGKTTETSEFGLHLTIKEPILFRRNKNNTLVMVVSKV